MNGTHDPTAAATVAAAPAVTGNTADSRLFLSAAEVGRQLGLKRSRVYELAAAGMLPVVRMGRRMLFPRRGLEALAETAIARVTAELDSAPEARYCGRRVA